jgi:hypothetical protein
MIPCGWGLMILPRRARWLSAGALAIASLSTHQLIQPRLDYDVAARTIAAEYSPGDIVVLETGWDDNAFRYELMLALPPDAPILRTLPWVNNRTAPEPVVPHIESDLRAHRRVWVVNWLQPSQVIPFLDAGNDGFRRILSRESSTGHEYATLYHDVTVRAVLFERPDLTSAPHQYGNLFTLHDAILSLTLRPNAPLHVDLWWSALSPVPQDYSVGVFLLDSSGKAVAQDDHAPGDKPTSAWTPGTLTFDRHTLRGIVAPGVYSVAVRVYWYQADNKPLLSEGQPYIIVGTVTVADS